MKDTYLAKDFRATAARRFPAQADALNAAFDARLQALRADNAAAGKEKQFHLEKQILPGIAAYETLQTVMPKEEALQTVHGYVEQRAWKLRKIFLALMRIPGLPRKTPGIFTKQTRRMFGEAAGFEAREIETTGGVWRIDMIKCPYHDACVHYGCPELCPCFCDSDDITYDDLHPRPSLAPHQDTQPRQRLLRLLPEAPVGAGVPVLFYRKEAYPCHFWKIPAARPGWAASSWSA